MHALSNAWVDATLRVPHLVVAEDAAGTRGPASAGVICASKATYSGSARLGAGPNHPVSLDKAGASQQGFGPAGRRPEPFCFIGQIGGQPTSRLYCPGLGPRPRRKGASLK